MESVFFFFLKCFDCLFFGRELKASEIEKLRLEKRLQMSEDAGRALNLRAANLETQLGEREAALRRIESAYNTQL